MKTLLAVIAALALSACQGVMLDPAGLDRIGSDFASVSAKYQKAQPIKRHVDAPGGPAGGIDLIAYTPAKMVHWKDRQQRVLVVAGGVYLGQIRDITVEDAAVAVFDEFANAAHKRGALTLAQAETAKLDHFVSALGLARNPYFAELVDYQRVQIGRLERKQIDANEYGYLVAQKRRELAASVERLSAANEREVAEKGAAYRALVPRSAIALPPMPMAVAASP